MVARRDAMLGFASPVSIVWRLTTTLQVQRPLQMRRPPQPHPIVYTSHVSASTPPPSPSPSPSESETGGGADASETASRAQVDVDAMPTTPGPAVDNASARAQALLDDIAANPEYYLNVTGVLVGITLSVIVLSATVVALDTLPVVPDVLRMIGLGYLFWFLGKFLFSATERARLSDDVDDFVAGVRGGEFRVIGGTEERADVALMESEDRTS